MKSSDKHYFQLSEDIVEILTTKTQTKNNHFYRVLVAYYFSKIASMMRCNIETKDRGAIPVNTYALNLMPSGAGKGFSTNIMEEDIIEGFRENFLLTILPNVSKKMLASLATKRAVREDITLQDATKDIEKEYNSLGKLAFSFDSGTSPAVKQMRQKLLMSNAGSMNLELDEVGSNLTANVEMLNTFLELYDVGKVKQKLTKNTTENTRCEELLGKTPTNMMLFGTPTKLLDGGKTEEEFKSMLETGYARRMLFGYDGILGIKPSEKTAEELYEELTNTDIIKNTSIIFKHITALADAAHFNTCLTISKENTIMLLQYKIQCEKRAYELKDHEETQKAELTHRYYKALKLAGAYAFVDKRSEITQNHLASAITLVEDSGEHFKRIMCKEGAYVKLAKYIASVGKEITQVDLIENLPFYKGNKQDKKELLTLAIAYGYKNNIIIRKTYVDDIEFLSGECLIETDLDKLHLSYSNDITKHYTSVCTSFKKFPNLLKHPNLHYTAHNFEEGYRSNENAIPGFDLIILDIDDGISLNSAKELLSEYVAIFTTTKRHTAEKNRFRVILPMSHFLKLEPREYSKFMENVFNWLPFPCDTATKDIARKWLTNPGEVHYSTGIELIDATLFIPQTKKAIEQEKILLDAKGLDHLERWFLGRIEVGNRATMILRYGFMLADSGMPLTDISTKLHQLNNRLPNPLEQKEIDVNILHSVSKKLI